ncbi:MAG: magnesium and cobalt transport protein CorA [Actinobacteria bacterium]|nr:magnesium and cobalt transport protein CorA [Actinomycetota bacterium]
MIRSIFRYHDGIPTAVDADIAELVPGAVPAATLQRLARQARHEGKKSPGSFIWLKLADPTESEWRDVAEAFSLPPLQVDDAKNPRQRPKLESSRHAAFMILKELRYVEESSDVETGQVSVFVGRGYAISVRHGSAAPGSSRERLAQEPELLRYGPIAVLYAVADVIIDGYLDVSNELDNDVTILEDWVFSGRARNAATTIYELKRENLELRRALAPSAMVARRLLRGDHPHIPDGMAPYFADVGEHILRAYELADSHDQLLMAMLMAVTSQQELQQNKDMRKISSWAAIIAVPTAIAGIYGMNFTDMPELNEPWAYPAVLLVMLSICVFLFITFKRSKWL